MMADMHTEKVKYPAGIEAWTLSQGQHLKPIEGWQPPF
jgi:hypothetical protein